jgi:hypothetical protein
MGGGGVGLYRGDDMKLKPVGLILLLPTLMLVMAACGGGQTADTPTQLPMATPTPYPTYTSVLPTATQVPLIPTPISAPEEGGICTLTGGETVKEGWSGKDTGSNHCNQCTCLDAGLACTKMACPTVNISPTPTSTAIFQSQPPPTSLTQSSVVAGGEYSEYKHSLDGKSVACGGRYSGYKHRLDWKSVCAGGLYEGYIR